MSIVQARVPVVWRPQPRQAEFMSRPEPEALYGGAAGGGKSDALVIEALRQVHIPHYRALILRKTYPQLSDLVDKSQVYYHRAFPQAQYNATAHVWNFPSGAKIYFGSMQYTKDRTNYQGKAFDFIGFDELTHFEWEEYSYMMSRNRPTGPGTRVYMRATTNPGGIGHGWVKARFITPAPPGTPITEEYTVKLPDGTEQKLQRARVFIPSSIFDNPAHIAHDYHTANANGHADSLLLDVVQAVAHAQVAGGVACAVQHYKAEHHDNGQRCQPVEQQPVPRSRVPLQRRHPCTFFLVFMLSAGGCHCHAPLFSESGAQAQRARRTASASPHTLSAHRL